jgi:hypothetical protein
MPDGPRKASLRAPSMMERIKSGLQDVVGIPEATWGMPMPDAAIKARRELTDAKAAKGPVMRAPTTMERIQDTLRPVTSVLETLGNPMENAEMGPSQAITLARRAAGNLPGRLTGEAELLERLFPRLADGSPIDGRAFPKTVEAVADAVKRYPRAASHLDSISMSLPETGADLGKFVSPNQYTKQIRSMGAEAFKGTGQTVGKIELSPAIEAATGRGTPSDTLFHEFGHLGQFIADPRRFQATYDEASRLADDSLGPVAKLMAGGDPGYTFNPAEAASRAIGRRATERTAGKPVTPYRKAVQAEVSGFSGPDALQEMWGKARQKFEDWAGSRGVSIAPR